MPGYLRFERLPGAVPELDGLRGIAILLVLGRHSVRVFCDSGEPLYVVRGWDLATPLLNGWMGVDLFFVLSGYLIAAHILRRFRRGFEPGEIRRYLARRVLRIVPAYYAFLLVVAFGLIPGYEVARDDRAFRLGYHFLFLQDYLPASFVVAFWSLGVEEKFYLLAPLIVVALARLPTRGRYGLLAVLFLVPLACRGLSTWRMGGVANYATWFNVLRSPFHMSFDGLVAGVACACLVEDSRSWRPGQKALLGRLLLAAGVTGVVALLFGAPLLERTGWFDGTVLGSVVSLAFGLAMAGLLLAPPGPLHRALAGRGLMFFARISFSLYLVHMVFMGSTFAWADGAFGLTRLARLPAYLIYFPCFAAVSVGAALLLYYLVEKPFLLLKDRVS